jgi:hypothetical protein
MLKACKALSKTANDGSGIIRLYCNQEYDTSNIRLAVKSEELADIDTVISAGVSQDCKVAVNINHLKACLTTAGKDSVIDMFITGTSYPVVLHDTESHFEVIMPMSVVWENETAQETPDTQTTESKNQEIETGAVAIA